MSLKPAERPCVTVYLTPAEMQALNTLAFASLSSVSQLGQLAIVRLLGDVHEGKLDLMPSYKGQNAGRA